MGIRISNKVSDVEREVIAAIHTIRGSDSHVLHAILLDDPARLMRHFILCSHGHVRLRFAPIANELAVEMRTLQRAFRDMFKTTMHQCQIQARLSYSKIMLGGIPPAKISVIAATLGYSAASDFVRFFEKQTQKTPTEWGREERDGRASVLSES